MSRYDAPHIMCDSMSGCTATDMDYYAAYADSVDGTKITRTRRAPGWLSTDHEDYCPRHTEENER